MEVIYLIFITMFNLKQPPKKERADQTTKMLENLDKQGIKMHVYWTLGRYDGVAINEAPTEKDAMKAILSFQNTKDSIKISEITLHVPGQTFVATEHSDEFEKSVNASVEKLSRQLKKLKTKRTAVRQR